jgi:hypothetical protein
MTDRPGLVLWFHPTCRHDTPTSHIRVSLRSQSGVDPLETTTGAISCTGMPALLSDPRPPSVSLPCHSLGCNASDISRHLLTRVGKEIAREVICVSRGDEEEGRAGHASPCGLVLAGACVHVLGSFEARPEQVVLLLVGARIDLVCGQGRGVEYLLPTCAPVKSTPRFGLRSPRTGGPERWAGGQQCAGPWVRTAQTRKPSSAQ